LDYLLDESMAGPTNTTTVRVNQRSAKAVYFTAAFLMKTSETRDLRVLCDSGFPQTMTWCQSANVGDPF